MLGYDCGQGFMELAEAKYAMGPSNVGQVRYDLDMEASTTLSRKGEGTATVLAKGWLLSTSACTESKSYGCELETVFIRSGCSRSCIAPLVLV